MICSLGTRFVRWAMEDPAFICLSPPQRMSSTRIIGDLPYPPAVKTCYDRSECGLIPLFTSRANGRTESFASTEQGALFGALKLHN